MSSKEIGEFGKTPFRFLRYPGYQILFPIKVRVEFRMILIPPVRISQSTFAFRISLNSWLNHHRDSNSWDRHHSQFHWAFWLETEIRQKIKTFNHGPHYTFYNIHVCHYEMFAPLWFWKATIKAVPPPWWSILFELEIRKLFKLYFD